MTRLFVQPGSILPPKPSWDGRQFARPVQVHRNPDGTHKSSAPSSFDFNAIEQIAQGVEKMVLSWSNEKEERANLYAKAYDSMAASCSHGRPCDTDEGSPVPSNLEFGDDNDNFSAVIPAEQCSNGRVSPLHDCNMTENGDTDFCPNDRWDARTGASDHMDEGDTHRCVSEAVTSEACEERDTPEFDIVSEGMSQMTDEIPQQRHVVVKPVSLRNLMGKEMLPARSENNVKVVGGVGGHEIDSCDENAGSHDFHVQNSEAELVESQENEKENEYALNGRLEEDTDYNYRQDLSCEEDGSYGSYDCGNNLNKGLQEEDCISGRSKESPQFSGTENECSPHKVTQFQKPRDGRCVGTASSQRVLGVSNATPKPQPASRPVSKGGDARKKLSAKKPRRTEELHRKRHDSTGSTTSTRSSLVPGPKKKFKSADNYRARVLELQISLEECAAEYEVKIVEMKMKMLQMKSECRQKEMESASKTSVVAESVILLSTYCITRIRKESDLSFKSLVSSQVEDLRKQLVKIQREKAYYAKELAELKRRERQFELQSRSLEDTFHLVNTLQRQLAKRQQEVVDCQIREKELRSQLKDIQIALHETRNNQANPEKLVTLLFALRQWSHSNGIMNGRCELPNKIKDNQIIRRKGVELEKMHPESVDLEEITQVVHKEIKSLHNLLIKINSSKKAAFK
eukprot:Gb_21176 [translate_table: standard]